MQLTDEQQQIIRSTGNIKINAVAGSGKTTTVVEYARARPRKSEILYLAFNKSVKLEAVRKFREQGLRNVRVETAHSLAHRHVVARSHYRLGAQGYKTHEIAEMLGLQGNGEKHAEYVIATHINRFAAYFFNSDARKIQNLNYFDTVTDRKARVFVTTFYDYIEAQTQRLLDRMERGDIEITHDFYLKKFQLSNPSLSYDYILFDEGQDASPAMLDIFLRQRATKVIVGDTHQQIYGWRHAVNSLEKADFATYQLSTSFRFGQPIADLAMRVLEHKKLVGNYQPIPIKGRGTGEAIESKAVLGRTNLGLLLKAIQYVTEKKKVERIYFEGNINSYTYADEGASLYDVLNLYNHKHHLIRDKLIGAMGSLEELEEYVEKTEDVQLGMMVEIVKKYQNEIPRIIREIKEKHIGNDHKADAELIFSTVHRCKGMEYDAVQLVNDFITEERLEELKDSRQLKDLDPARLHEEINLLYVAITRTKSTLYIPEALMPLDFPKSSQIKIIKKPVADAEGEKVEESNMVFSAEKKSASKGVKEKAYTVDEVRKQHPDAYQPWTPEMDREVVAMKRAGKKTGEIARHFGRTKGAITSRIKKLE